MIADTFVDTNVLVYAAAGGHDAPEKHARAWQIIAPGNYGISAQVLAEFYVNATRKPSVPLSPAEAAAWMTDLRSMPVVPVDASLVAEAADRSRSHQISYWDAAIIVAAERLGATTLYSEDLNDGQTYGSVTVVNPFKTLAEGAA
jgi:predicted nucleic acid-binding protein